MIEFRQGGRRRLDRVLDPGFLAAIGDRSLDELRAMRDDAAQEETDLSYLRRLLHARIDIVRFEEHRRANAGGDGESSLVEALPRILADNAIGPAAGRGRHQTVQPSRAESHRRHVEALLADTGLSDVATLSDAELTESAEAYAAEEGSVSDHRIRVQQVMDACNDEIGRRYRDGSASIDELLRREREGA
ncbi:aerial mycelium formation protein [Actinomycetospora termitidis]|uniref:Aerial mycelium formation protein n=1 Tax=Actinomycetospora termitidis TaxID=3053470 RepID=A0ABT7M4E3_9PSEU|nr:aerial mycelium formation protein [Actinomycetospora sp. Odt1-22]MDL5155099.1 aerial mycelium formation protein [Actinomycetospora sp. Odt1-22]